MFFKLEIQVRIVTILEGLPEQQIVITDNTISTEMKHTAPVLTLTF